MTPRARRRWILAGGIAVILAAGLGVTLAVLLNPAQMRRRVEAALGEIFACPFRFEALSVGPGGITIQGLELDLPLEHGGISTARVPEVSIHPRLSSLLAGPLEILELDLTRPDIALEYDPKAGTWNVGRLFRRREGGAPPVIRRMLLEGARVRLCPACFRRLLGRTEAEEPPPGWLRLEMDGEGSIGTDGGLTFQATVRHPALKRLHVHGTGDLHRGSARLEVTLRKLRLSDDLESLLPPAVRDGFRSVQALGYADMTGSAELDGGRLRQASARVNVLNCAGQIPPLPGLKSAYPLRHITARAMISPTEIVIDEAKGILGEGRFAAMARIRLDEGWRAVTEATFRVEADRIPIDARLRDALEPRARRIWDRYNPSGAIGLVVDRKPGRGAEATVILRGVGMRYFRFPYPADGLRGEIRIQGDRAEITKPIEGERGGAHFSATGRFGLTSRDPVEIQIRASDVPLDAALRAALPARHRRIWDALDPSGTADAVTTITQPAGEGRRARLRIDVDLEGAAARYEAFRYRLEGITGRVRFDDEGAEIAGIRGTHGTSTIEIPEGTFRGGGLHLRISSPALRVDPDLQAALPEAFRKTIEEFGFEGTVGVDATIDRAGPDEPVEYAIKTEIRSGAILYRSFPYPVELAGGTVEIRRDGVILKKIRSRGETPSIAIERGSVDEADGMRRYDVTIAVDRLPVDDRLRAALPAHLRRFVEGVGLRGTFSGDVDVMYRHAVDDPSRYRVRYVVRASSEGADIDFGIRFRRIQGWTHFAGSAASDAPHSLRGTAHFDAFQFHRAHLGPTDIAFAYGVPHQALARPVSMETYPVPQRYRDRLTPERARTAFQVLAERADLYGGDVRGFLYVDVGPAGVFDGEFVFSEVDLRKAAPDLLHVKDASGKGRGSALFRGEIGKPRTMRGRGQLRIEDAQLVRLPLLLGLFRILKLEVPQRTYFKQVRVDYRIDQGRFVAPHWDSIELTSDALSFRGGGRIDFDLGLDLYLSPVFFPGIDIPLLGPLLGRIKQNLVAIQVRGPLDDPKVSYVLVKDIVDLFGPALQRPPADLQSAP